MARLPAAMQPIFLVLAVAIVLPIHAEYTPDWPSIDSRPLPSWYDEAKVGIFIHWSVFSVPSYHAEAAFFWLYWREQANPTVIDFIQKNYPPDFQYGDFAAQFKAELFNPSQWADIFAASGAKYVVLTSKHHEGFTNWPSPLSWNWNAGDVGPHRDLVGELGAAIRNRTDMHYGLYYSQFEWFNPLYVEDKKNGFKTQNYVKLKTQPEMKDLITRYKPDVLWSDGDWEAPDTYWNSTHFLAWLYNESPVKDTIVTNDRWGVGCICKHGGYLTCSDKYNPGHLMKRKYENAMTIDSHSWGYRRDSVDGDYLTVHDLLSQMAETVSCGGNILMNVGPTADGRILPVFESRLRAIGDWLRVNGEAIYGTKPWAYQNDTTTTGVWYTKKADVVYALALSWPVGELNLGAPHPSASTTVELVGSTLGPLKWKSVSPQGISITVPNIPITELPCKEVFVFKFSGLTNLRARPTIPELNFIDTRQRRIDLM